MKGVITRKNLKSPMFGFSSTYSEGRIVISAIQTPVKSRSDEYFKIALLPNFNKMKNHFN